MPRIALLLFSAVALSMPVSAQDDAVEWKACLKQKPAWYAGEQGVRVAENVLLYQRDSGGWPKNLDMAKPLDNSEKKKLAKEKTQADSTIDNGATCTQLLFLARVFNATKTDRFRDAFLRGLDYLLQAQYENGGWPQFYPKPTGYRMHITFNDNAMVNVMSLLRDVAKGNEPYAFVDVDRRTRATKAVEKGVRCILDCQVRVDDKRTAWCAQHDEKTLQPAKARAYEHPSLSGLESVGIVRFLMSIEPPEPEVIEAVKGAVAWFQAAKLTGIREETKDGDKIVVADPAAPPLWARFHEIGTNKPIFSGRDGVIKYSLAEIEHERRTGYGWYTTAPASLLEKEYPAWENRDSHRR
jgi:PelA/Pel-15E family pectate lyase